MERDSSSTALRVLVVDDCADTTWSLALLLQAWGHEALIAHDGPRALELAAVYHPHVVLLDIALPGMDGLEVARRLRQAEGPERSYLLGVSGYGQEEDRLRSLAAGFDDHWIKPVEPEDLHRLLASRTAGGCR
jgi:CheY-like chemotaxis protein